ncbi:MAG: FG-GAP repeat domain-containing protein [Thermoplasmata archaeon]
MSSGTFRTYRRSTLFSYRRVTFFAPILLLISLVLPNLSPICPIRAQSWAEAEYSVGNGPKDIVISDLNGDGWEDVITVNKFSNDVSILFNKGDDTFLDALSVEVDYSPNDVQLADIDNDGDVDIVTCHRFLREGEQPGNNNISVLYNDGTGDFFDQLRFEVGEYCFSLFLSDVGEDSNGDIDIVTIDDENNEILILYNDGTGRNFAFAGAYQTGERPKDICLADLDGDGFSDIVTANWLADEVSILENNGNGTFMERVDYPAGEEPRSAHLADIDGDADIDIVTANQFGSSVSFLKNNGDGTFSEPLEYPVGAGPISVYTGDLDEDGDTDILTANLAGKSVSYVLNSNDGTFSPGLNRTLPGSPSSILLADLGGTAGPVVVVSDYEANSIHVLSKDLPPSIILLEPDGVEDQAGKEYEIIWIDQDLDDDASIDLYYCYATHCSQLYPIVSGISEDNEMDRYNWVTSEIPDGDYLIVAVISDDYTSETANSSGYVAIRHPIVDVIVDNTLWLYLWLAIFLLILLVSATVVVLLKMRKARRRGGSKEGSTEEE